MTTYTFPSGFVTNNISWIPPSNTAIYQSKLNDKIQTVSRPGGAWRCTATFPPMLRSNAGPLIALMVRLRGGHHSFEFPDFSLTTPIGVATGTPRINGASQAGTSLATDGWTTGVTGILKASDMFGFENQLHMVIEDANSNGSGQATLTIEPPLRSSPTDNALITTTKPSGVFKLTPPFSWQVDAGKFVSLGFEAMEVL